MINDYDHDIIDPVVIGNFIKELRLSHNLTQDELAEKIFVTRKAVSKWETGKAVPSLDTIKDLDKLFGITFEELTNGTLCIKNENIDAIKLLWSNPFIKLAIYILIISLLLLYDIALNNRADLYYSFTSNHFKIPDNKINYDNHIVFETDDIEVYNLKEKYVLSFYLKNKNKLLYRCEYYNNKCDEKYYNENVTYKTIKKNLKDIVLNINYGSEFIEEKIFVHERYIWQKSYGTSYYSTFNSYNKDVFMYGSTKNGLIINIPQNAMYTSTKDLYYLDRITIKFNNTSYLIYLNERKNALMVYNNKNILVQTIVINKNQIVSDKNNSNYIFIQEVLIPYIESSYQQ